MPVTIGNLRSTWANSSITYTGLGLNVNATSYDANSALIDLQLNSNSLLRLTSNGVLYVNNFPIGVDANTWANTKLSNTSGISFAGYLSFPTGNVGIGLSNAATKLEVSRNTGTLPSPVSGTLFRVAGADSANPRILIDGFAGTPVLNFRRSQGTAASPSALTTGVNISAIVSFGYGTTGYSSTSRATINSVAEETWTDTAHGTNWRFYTTAIGTTTLSERMRITANGNVGIGTTDPTYPLDVSGNINSSNTVFAVHFDNVSDISLKENIEPIENSIDTISKLNPVSFTWKNNKTLSYGLIAQEVEKILPSIVHSKTDNTKTINYIELIAFLLSAIKEQQKQIDDINKRIDA